MAKLLGHSGSFLFIGNNCLAVVVVVVVVKKLKLCEYNFADLLKTNKTNTLNIAFKHMNTYKDGFSRQHVLNS